MMSSNSSVLISDLNLPSRVKRILLQNNIQTWGDLEALSHDDLEALSGMAINVLPDVESALDEGDVILREHTIRRSRINAVYNNVRDIKLSTLNLSNYARHDLLKADIKAAGELIQLSKEDVKALTSSDDIRQEINNAIDKILDRKIKDLVKLHPKVANITEGESQLKKECELENDQYHDKENELENVQQPGKEQENENGSGAHKEQGPSYDHELGSDMPDVRQKRFTDELEDYIVRGKTVYVSEDSDLYKTLMAYAEEKGISLDEYIKQLGYIRTTEDPDCTTSLSEDDMQVHEGSKGVIEDIFAKYPLLGSKIFTKEEEKDLHDRAKKCLDNYLQFNEIPYLKEKMYIALSVINYAKDWDYEKSPDFWSYLILQYGYRDSSNTQTLIRRISNLLKSSVKDALKENGRLFIKSNRGWEYKSTIVIHAFASKRSWIALFEFLFDFYKDNLDWNLIPGDPLIGEMVHYLQSKFSDSDKENIDLNIGSSKVYRFQEGIRKLILFRPIYTQYLFEKLLARIDGLIQGKTLNIETYEEQLCDEWFNQHLIEITMPKEHKERQRSIRDDLAINYTRIHAKYLLNQKDQPCLDLPEIRLLTEDSSEVMLTIYCKNVKVYQKTMSWYGNELGRTLKHVSMSLSEIKLLDLSPDIDMLNLQVHITCGEKEIYDSGTDLYREMLIFTGMKEIRSKNLIQGNYIIILPAEASYDYKNAEFETIDAIQILGLDAYYVKLNKDFLIRLNDTVIAFDHNTEHDIRIMYPDEYPGENLFIKDDIEYEFIPCNSSCTILVNNAEIIDRYIFYLNNERVHPIQLEQSDETESTAFGIQLKGMDGLCQIDIFDIEHKKPLYKRNFCMVSTFISSFDRPFYFSDRDYKNASYHLTIDEFSTNKPFYKVDDEVRVPYHDGYIQAYIPKITVIEKDGNWLHTSIPAIYIDEISQISQLIVTAPKDVDLHFFIGNEDINYDGHGICEIGNALQSLRDNNSLSEVEIRMLASSNGIKQEYILQRVFYHDGFTKNLEFWYKDNKLYWNQGGCFIGRKDPDLTLFLTGESDESLRFNLSPDAEFFELPDNISTGNYKYKVIMFTSGLFTKNQEEVLSEGTCLIGDPNELRFKHKRIVLDAITNNFKFPSLISIRPCYIDHIKFIDIGETSEGVRPIYSGTLYEPLSGQNYYKRPFSSSEHYDKFGNQYMKVNPVKIVYISDLYLCITNQDDDGLYYYQDQETCILTDREYTSKTRNNYSIPDLYSYHVEHIKDR